MNLQPIDDFIQKGLALRWQQQFDCIGLLTNVHEKTKALQRWLDGKEVTYPYAFLSLQSMTAPTDSYNAHSMGRRGLPVVVDQGHLYAAKIIPMNFEYEVQFVTNQFQSRDQGSVISFMRRWHMARRFGYLKFQVTYGRIIMGINVTLNEAPPVPVRENVVEAEQAYTVTTNLTVHGYISEPILGEQGVIEQLNVDEFYSAMPNAKFKPFKRSSP